jgi:hypothetical protein
MSPSLSRRQAERLVGCISMMQDTHRSRATIPLNMGTRMAMDGWMEMRRQISDRDLVDVHAVYGSHVLSSMAAFLYAIPPSDPSQRDDAVMESIKDFMQFPHARDIFKSIRHDPSYRHERSYADAIGDSHLRILLAMAAPEAVRPRAILACTPEDGDVILDHRRRIIQGSLSVFTSVEEADAFIQDCKIRAVQHIPERGFIISMPEAFWEPAETRPAVVLTASEWAKTPLTPTNLAAMRSCLAMGGEARQALIHALASQPCHQDSPSASALMGALIRDIQDPVTDAKTVDLFPEISVVMHVMDPARFACPDLTHISHASHVFASYVHETSVVHLGDEADRIGRIMFGNMALPVSCEDVCRIADTVSRQGAHGRRMAYTILQRNIAKGRSPIVSKAMMMQTLGWLGQDPDETMIAWAGRMVVFALASRGKTGIPDTLITRCQRLMPVHEMLRHAMAHDGRGLMDKAWVQYFTDAERRAVGTFMSQSIAAHGLASDHPDAVVDWSHQVAAWDSIAMGERVALPWQDD